MNPIESTRRAINDANGLSAGAVKRATRTTQIAVAGMMAFAGWALWAEHKAGQRDHTLYVFDKNYAFLGAFDVGKDASLHDAMFAAFASRYIRMFRPRPSAKEDYESWIKRMVDPITDDAIKPELSMVSAEQVNLTGARDVEVIQVTRLRLLDRPKPTIARVEIEWLEAQDRSTTATSWSAILTIEWRPQPSMIEINAVQEPFMLIAYQSTYLGQVPRPDRKG